MYAPRNQIQAPDDKDEDPTDERNDVVRICKEPVQESFLAYYNHNFGHSLHQKCIDFACPNPLKTSHQRLIQEGFDLASPKTKAKKRKSDALDGGGRVIRAAGRKDRHCKVRTARGPRDRRLRLSPATAIQFYDVKDRLGCDRPSKAIDWLINEAKAAIDALEEHQGVKLSDSNAADAENHGGFSFSQRGMRENEEHLTDVGLVSAFSSFVNEAAAPPAAAYLARDGSSAAWNAAPQNLETNWEIGRLQKMFTWNSVNENSSTGRGGGGGGGAEYFPINSLPPHAAAQVNSGHSNSFREPLQSSIINHDWMNNDLGGFSFSDELWKIAASAHHQD